MILLLKHVLIATILSLIFCTFNFPHECTPAEKAAQFCTEEYFPVCAWFSQAVKCIRYPCAINAPNPCNGCRNENVEYLTRGECPTDYKKQYCTPSNKRAKVCTMEYDPHCGYSFHNGQSIGNMYSNFCEACISPAVEYAISGEC